MGAAIDALPRAAGLVRRSPALIGATTVALVAGTVLSVVVTLLTLFVLLPVGNLLAPAFLAFFASGVVGMVYHAARDGEQPGLSAYGDAITDSGGEVLAAFLVRQLVLIAVAFVAVILSLFLGVGLAFSGGFGGPASGGFGGLGLLITVLYAVVTLFSLGFTMVFQFLDVAIVVGDESVMGSFGESWSLFLEDPLSVVGYSVIRLGLFVAAAAVIFALAFVGELVSADLGLLLAAIGSLVGAPVVMTLNYVYHAQYYLHRRPESLRTPSRDSPRSRRSQATRTTGHQR